MKSRLFMSLIALIALAGCSSPPIPAPTKAEPDGITARLTRSTTPTLYNLEKINGVVDPASHAPVSVPAGEDLTITGWAVDQTAQSAPAGVEIVVDGKPYRAKSGLDRIDVADHFHLPGYAKAGFSFSAGAGSFGKGAHQLSLRIIAKDGANYFESPALTVNVQ